MRAPKSYRSVHVPPGGGSVEQGSLDDLDLISRLPDEVLGTVVSLLPINEGARTQVLSRRWLPLWRSPMAPLNLAVDHLSCSEESCIPVVSKILSDHPGPARRFSFPIQSLWADKVGGWLCSDSLAGLKELEVVDLRSIPGYLFPPHALIRFAPTLRLLNLGSCQYPGPGLVASFPRLKHFICCNVDISEDSLQSIFSGCAVLESVSLHRTIGFCRICITSPTLRSISFITLLPSKRLITLEELVIENAPCLERLIPLMDYSGPVNIRVIHAPKLNILGCLSRGISTLRLGTTVFQKMIAASLTTKMHTVKILALDFTRTNPDAVIDFLKCFPYLEKIHVILHDSKDMNILRKYDPLDPIECLELHLTKVVIKSYDGNKRPFIDFANFFILNAKVLKQIEIRVLNRESEKWMCCQRRKLQVENRASRDAEIALRRDTYASPTNDAHAHDFSMADPFE